MYTCIQIIWFALLFKYLYVIKINLYYFYIFLNLFVSASYS